MLIRQERPRSLDEIIGQDPIIFEMKRRSLDLDFFPVMLFSGGTGRGKTSLCFIVAALINCKNPRKEVDASGHQYQSPCLKCASCASIIEGGFDRDTHCLDGSRLAKSQIDELDRITAISPFYDRNRINIIDEIQELGFVRSYGSLLKLVEKPQDGLYFLFTTMHVEKVPEALQHRCQHYQFQPVPVDEITQYLRRLLKTAQLPVEPPATFAEECLPVIALHSNGDVRKAVQDLERCLYGRFFSREEVQNGLGYLSKDVVIGMVTKLYKKNFAFFKDMNKIDLVKFFNDSWPLLNNLLLDMMRQEQSNRIPHDSDRGNKQLFDLLEVYQRTFSESGGGFNENIFRYRILEYFNNQ